MSSLAQDELGHAQALYQLLAQAAATTAAIRRDRLRPDARRVPPRPAPRPRPRRLVDDDRPALPLRHRRRGPARGARVVVVRAVARPRRQDPARGALPPHARDDVARAPRRSRGRAARPAARRARRAGPGRRHGVHADRGRGSPCRGRSDRGADGRDRGPLAGEHHPDVRRPRPCRCRPPPSSRTAGRATASRSAGSGTSSRWSVATTRWRRGDRDRRAVRGPPPCRRRLAVRAALAEVPDPELPVVSVVDLGIVERVDVAGGRIAVELIPTFIGCPALELIEASVDAAPGVVRRPGRGRLHPARALDVRADHGGGPGPAPRRGHRAAARPGRHALPVVRLRAGRHGQRVRPDAVPVDAPLPRLPPAVRGAQASLTAASGRRTQGRC